MHLAERLEAGAFDDQGETGRSGIPGGRAESRKRRKRIETGHAIDHARAALAAILRGAVERAIHCLAEGSYRVLAVRAAEGIQGGERAAERKLEDRPHVVGAAVGRGSIEITVAGLEKAVGAKAIRATGEGIERRERAVQRHAE